MDVAPQVTLTDPGQRTQAFLPADAAVGPVGGAAGPVGPVLAGHRPGDGPVRLGRLPGRGCGWRLTGWRSSPGRCGCGRGWSRPSCCAGSAGTPAVPSATGVEFAGLRPYAPGDQLRDVNRAVSIRRGQLHVNQRSAARARRIWW